MPFNMKMNFQEFTSLNMKNMMQFSDMLNDIMLMILVMILFFISFSCIKSIYTSTLSQKESSSLEMFWTIIPSVVILFLSFPSLSSLYLNEEFKKPSMDTMVSGNQWYWSYNYPSQLKFNSYINQSLFQRNLATDYSIILPNSTNVRMTFTSNDVIHSWTIPSLMVKSDAVPGRMNMVTLKSLKSSKLKGQCSEICGANHSFMPISVLFMKTSS